MKTLIEIYELLQALNRCRSQHEFSVKWLGRSKGYFAYLRSSASKPSPTSLLLLSARIREAAPAADDERYFVERRKMLSAAVAVDVWREAILETGFVPREYWCTAR